MNEIRLDNEAFHFFSAFERLTHTKALDCYVTDHRVIFIVENGSLEKALGKNKSNLNRLKAVLKKSTHIVEYSPKPEQFVANIFSMIWRFKVNRSEILEQQDHRQVCVVWVRPQDKGLMIGKGSRNLHLVQELTKRHHHVDDVRIKSGM
jgi:NusA-like KH domain protein